MKIVTLRCSATLFCLALSTDAHAIIGISSEVFTGPDPSVVSSSDLVNQDSPDLLAVSSTPIESLIGMNDGSVAGIGAIQQENSEYPASIEFHLDTTANPLGYSISAVSTVTGLSQPEAQVTEWFSFFTELSPQLYTLSYSLVGEASFNELVTVSDLGSAPIRKVTLIGLSSEIDGGVDALRFTWLDPYPGVLMGVNPSDETLTIVREIDVFGSAITEQVPEPGTAATTLCLCGMLTARRWRRARARNC